MVDSKEFAQQTGVISVYRLFGVLQFSVGFLLIFFASYVGMVIHGPVVTGLPYYVGSIIVACMLLSMSYLAAIIYDSGERVTSKDTRLLENIYFMMKVHFVVSLAALVISIASTVLTGIYGLSEQCSYSTNMAFNQGMAIFLVILLASSNLLLLTIVIYFFKYCKHFDTSDKGESIDTINGVLSNR